MSGQDATLAAPASLPRRGGAGWGLALRFAFREMRGGLRGFAVFLACIALGVAAIAGVGSLARSLQGGIAREGRTILGGDLSFTLIHRRAEAAERGFLEGLGRVSEVATMRAMARTADGSAQTLVELKAVDAAYPLAGTVELAHGGSLDAALAVDGEARPGALVEQTLLDRLGIGIGDTLVLGRGTFVIRDVIASEPDKLAGGLEFGPRVMIAQDALEATALIRPGSLVRWRYRVLLPDGTSDVAVSAVRERAREAFPDAGWRITARSNAAPGLARSVDRFAEFLTLVGLTALIVGGVGVANAITVYLERKRTVIATFKCLGAPGTLVFRIYLLQTGLIAAIGIAIGLAVGALVPALVGRALADLLPVGLVGGLYLPALLTALAYGLLTAAAFALWPLGRAREVPASALFRDLVTPHGGYPRRGDMAAIAAIVATLATLAIGLATNPKLGAIYAVAAVAVFAFLFLIARGLMAFARALPRPNSAVIRLALANIHRPGALTPSVVLSLGLGLTLLVSITMIDSNLRRELVSVMPERAPSFFFLDIQRSEADAFAALLGRIAPEGQIEQVPMLRGTITAVNGVPAAELKPDPEARWALSGDRGITYSDTVPENSRVTEGHWWSPGYDGEPLVSFEEEVGRGLGLQIDDTVSVNVLGREVTVRVANFRTVDWESLSINFVMVFSPNTFAGAPHTVLATLTLPEEGRSEAERAVLSALTRDFPTVTSIRVRDALDQINSLVGNLMLGIRAASSIALIASVLVLASALAAGRRSRIYDAVVLKTLGATRGRLIQAFAIEYAVLGLAVALFAIIAGSIAAWAILSFIMDLQFAFAAAPAIAAILVALVLTVGFGLIGTVRVLGHKPARVLREQ